MKKVIIITAYIIFMISMIAGGYYYQTKECWKNSTKDDMGIKHKIKC